LALALRTSGLGLGLGLVLLGLGLDLDLDTVGLVNITGVSTHLTKPYKLGVCQSSGRIIEKKVDPYHQQQNLAPRLVSSGEIMRT